MRLYEFFYHLLPVSHQIDIRTAKFLENVMCSENYSCTLFKNKADSYLKKISVGGNTMSLQFRGRLSSCEVSLLLCVFLRFFFVVVISFHLYAMLPLLANKDEYTCAAATKR